MNLMNFYSLTEANGLFGDPNRPKSNKASILIVTIQTLKDLMTQVDRPKAEYVTLSQESRERATSNRLSQSNQQPMMNGSDWHHQRG
ncbi:hypothetical protein N665_0253s0009 [Sinapis alba]|nr:hypothetical protein N665_0253s0009 [Sinapis alba]